MPKVSIIVPVYNVEGYLAKCLDSLVHQSLESIEILVVNDGSTDGSQVIIDGYLARYPEKIKVFNKKNGGLSDARNYGIEHATGDYIGFVDSDDYVEGQMFGKMLDLAEKHSADIVICNLQKVDETGSITQKLPQLPGRPEKINLEEDFSLFAEIGFFACNKIFKRALFNQRRFKKGIHFEDIQLVPQLFLEAKIVAHTTDYLYNYLERSDSITKTHTAKGLDILQAVDDVGEYFRGSRFKNETNVFKNFVILQGVYSFLAYLAFVKNDDDFNEMSAALKVFCKKNNIQMLDILRYKRFGKNYLLSLPLRKKIYYLLYFSGQKWLIRKII